MSGSNRKSFSIDLSSLFVVFLILKLCGVIKWSWWWVTSPLWIPIAIVMIIVAVAFCVMYFYK